MSRKKLNLRKLTDNIIVDKNMKDYRNDPYVEKKTADAIEFIRKHGMPERFKNKTK